MANRVVLGAFDGTYVLRVSRPGFNVLSTGLTTNQLAFDSRWSDTGLEFMSGNFTADNSGSVTINYGTTFATPPTVIFRIIGDGGAYKTTDSNWTLEPATGVSNVNVNTSSFTFTKGSGGHPFPTWSGSRTVYYTVLRNLV